MIIELKPEQEQILELATRSGMSREQVLDQAFAVIREQHEMDEWMLANREEIGAHIEEGFAQAERGELIPDYEVKRILQERRRQRDIA
jgi:predicted transcriptional regulator